MKNPAKKKSVDDQAIISAYEDEYKKINFFNKTLEEYGIYMLMGEIGGANVHEAIRYIIEANINPECNWDFITLIINSDGGYVSDGFALIDIMLGSSIPIRTVGIGMIASMGLLIFLTGEKGTRTMTPNSMILSHQYAGGFYGKEHELVAAQVEQDNLSEIMMRHYKKTTGLSQAKIREVLLPPHDVWLKAVEAKKYGICDIVKDVNSNKIKRGK
jgi:ATP-dependent Clp protease protease subunit